LLAYLTEQTNKPKELNKMNDLQHCKYVAAIKPAAIIDNASATATVIDTRGFDYLTVVVTLGATDIAVTALSLENCSTSGGSYAAISGATFSAGNGLGGATLALPSATDDGQVCVFHVDMRGKEPFVKVVATFGDGSLGGFVAASAILSRAKIAPFTSVTMADGDVCLVV
jgi:hypothetical protein